MRQKCPVHAHCVSRLGCATSFQDPAPPHPSMERTRLLSGVLAAQLCVALASLASTPPMGWMSWEIFRCELDCEASPTSCIDESLYMSVMDALVDGGFLAAGYRGVHIDDCWMASTRDPVTMQLRANTTRFPHGISGLADYIHNKSGTLGLYTAESVTTCEKFPASMGHEELDANTFASWGVDYVKVDGCSANVSYYSTGYPLMGSGLRNSKRDITYSCSWPGYLGNNETAKPYPDIIAAGCNLWRNWRDIQCTWDSLLGVIDYWGDNGPHMQRYAGPGHWNDPDMLLIGNDCINEEEARTQMAIWSIVAAPLIMGNDPRNVSQEAKRVLLNREAIDVNQDPQGLQGLRISPKGAQEVWARTLDDGSIAVALFNKNGNATSTDCGWKMTSGGYYEACGGTPDEAYFHTITLDEAQSTCCGDSMCAGFSFRNSSGMGYYMANTTCAYVSDPTYDGYFKPNFVPTVGAATSITLDLSLIGFPDDDVYIRDIWAQKDLGTFRHIFVASNVSLHDSVFLRIKLVHPRKV